jgi:CDP-diacylglycerol--glycerol-3-phosphate 3-phosphatidyltransferase
MEKNLIPDWLKNGYVAALNPLIRLSSVLHIHPNFFTTLSLLISLAATLVLANGDLRLGGILILVSGTFDIIDGAVARATNTSSKFGALFDSTLDRYAELAVFFGILAYYFRQGYADSVLIPIAFALCGSFMVSYIRARAEGLGFDCKMGWMQRPERIVLLGFGAIFSERILMWFIILIAILSNITAFQRVLHIWKLSSDSQK